MKIPCYDIQIISFIAMLYYCHSWWVWENYLIYKYKVKIRAMMYLHELSKININIRKHPIERHNLYKKRKNVTKS